MSKKKIAVLGGGMSALATVFELTNEPDWQERYDITVYQMGWRLGGKTATGRGVNGRVEEVGIHILQGWYKRVFKVLKTSYEYCHEHGLFPDDFPFAQWQDAFEREDATLLTHWFEPKQKWIARNIILPPNNLDPSDDKPESFTVTARKTLHVLYNILAGKPYDENEQTGWFGRNVLMAFAEGALRDAIENLQTTHLDANGARRMVETLKKLQQGLTFASSFFSEDNEYAYWAQTFLEFVLVVARGFFEDIYNPETAQSDFERINHLDFREWLKQKGMSQRTLDSPLTRFAYFGTFADLIGEEGAIGAGAAMNFITTSLSYRGSFLWKFRMGTGDTLVAPVYMTLRHRGVKFKFFHKALAVHHSATGEIEEITMAKQVKLIDEETGYEPLYEYKGAMVWSAEPLYDQIIPAQAKRLKTQQINLESAWCKWKNAETFQLQKGKDFDYVVLAIPIGALGGEQGICKEIIDANPAWQNMYAKIKTTPTFAVQAYFESDYAGMGTDLQKDFAIRTTPNMVTYAPPLNSQIDESALIPHEGWEEILPKMLIYFCSAAPDLPKYRDFDNPNVFAEAKEELIETFRLWLQDNMELFYKHSKDFDFSLLFDNELRENPTEEERLRSQYFYPNIEPSTRYTLAVPGSSQARLRADESGYRNMILAGDWTNYGANVGYVEGATTSGILAAEALRRAIAGEE